MNRKGDQPVKGSELRQVQTAPVVVAIDDDRVILLAIAKALASAGMVCHTATTGAAGLRLIREHQTDLVLLDILLVGEDGFTLCQEIRRTWSPEQLPVIMVTGLEDLESIKAAYASGANDFLAKPLHWKHLPYRIRHVLEASREITERKRMESALRESEENQRILISHIPGIVYRCTNDADWTMSFISDEVERLLGYPASEFINSAVRSYASVIHPDDREAVARAVQESISARRPYAMEYRLCRHDGETIWVQERGRGMFDSNGVLLWTDGVVTDISERKKAERALQENERMLNQLIGNLPGFVYRSIHVGNWILDYLSEGFREITGYSSEDFIGNLNVSYNNLIQPSHRDIIRSKWQQVLQNQSVFQEEYPITTASQEIRWVWERGRGTYDGEGHLLFVEGFITDITERKRMEAALRETEAHNRQLLKAESLGRMAGAIAHHFNNKLHSVMANLELMSELPMGMDPGQCLTRAKRATEKAAEVSRLLLVYLGQGSGRGEPLFLSGLCRDSLAHLQSTLPDTVTLEADYPSPGPVIRANADQIQQILASLVANAREAIGDARGGIHLGLSTCPGAEIRAEHRFPIGWQAQEPDYACLEVADTGCGIVDEDIERLFDPFFSTKFTGRGLGLSVVLGVVQGHGGVITVESKPGHGSVFRIYLPTYTEARLRMPEMGGPASAPEGVGSILLVDDDEGLLMATGALIERMGFTLLTAKDGAEAVEVFRQHRAKIRCVITDLTMPRMDGWETLTALRQIEPAIPVILASGYDKAQVMSGAHTDLPQAFLGKPFGLQQLRDAVGQALAVRERGVT